MVYRNEHNCDRDCTRLVAYVRIEGKWEKIGHYGSECKKFEPIDLEKEEQERLDKENHDFIKSRLRHIKQEGRARLNTIKNVNDLFLK